MVVHSAELRFIVAQGKIGSRSTYILGDRISGESVTILPFLGGAINGMVLKNNNILVDVIDGYTSLAAIEETLQTTFKGSSLFPFPNRLADGTYHYEGIRYQLFRNFPHENNAIHGLVYDKEFDLLKKVNGESECVLVLCYQATGNPTEYPFSLRLEQSYRLNKKSGFLCTSTITNLSDGTVPIGQGWHPYFKLGNKKISELYLQLPSVRKMEVDRRNIPTGEFIDYTDFSNPGKIGDCFLDSCFKLDKSDSCTTLFLEDQNSGHRLEVWWETGDKKYNYLQVYTPQHGKSIAIEPMSCAPDALNNREGLILLAPKESISLSWGVSMSGDR